MWKPKTRIYSSLHRLFINRLYQLYRYQGGILILAWWDQYFPYFCCSFSSVRTVASVNLLTEFMQARCPFVCSVTRLDTRNTLFEQTASRFEGKRANLAIQCVAAQQPPPRCCSHLAPPLPASLESHYGVTCLHALVKFLFYFSIFI